MTIFLPMLHTINFFVGGAVSQEFLLWVFFVGHVPPGPWVCRWDSLGFFGRIAACVGDAGGGFATGVGSTGGGLPLGSAPPMSAALLANNRNNIRLQTS
jgi:hypothetical protein